LLQRERRLLADCVAKRFCLLERARSIQDHRPIRDVDFKNSHGQIHSFQIYIPQLRHGDFCNNIGTTQTLRHGSLTSAIAGKLKNICSS
jgi:hypothetical protein